ncbi:XRE family transcriptional regulator [Shinella yambaruensis]|uniref:Transcriptional regulator n=1 Tax=Shinella yambaruensis TaxID=415996 RepID=A0ABQ5ZKR3_9HYPH|nr:XRE family transcriptional regulator [Shinella yambaruensis]MCJ8027052.1 XRE family transcriptional regulator [Shinella yambaruensis]MCU7982057.1 XRE family transcriptional regulator [Shinella yambaruensis]GLR51232.1 transcriptional regulator [Shinella yambaruensis]
MQVREKLGFSSQRAVFAATVGLTEAMLGYYERGDRTPDALALAEFRTKHGISLSWLITGDGSMFDDASKAPAPSVGVDPQLLRRLYRAARLAYKDAGQLVPDEDSIAVEAGKLYNALLQEVSDIRQERIVDAVIPVVVDDLKTRLREANAEPGSGKRSASS